MIADTLSQSPVECVSALELLTGAAYKLSSEELGNAAAANPLYQKWKQSCEHKESRGL